MLNIRPSIELCCPVVFYLSCNGLFCFFFFVLFVFLSLLPLMVNKVVCVLSPGGELSPGGYLRRKTDALTECTLYGLSERDLRPEHLTTVNEVDGEPGARVGRIKGRGRDGCLGK